jgi:hypothetical protein
MNPPNSAFPNSMPQNHTHRSSSRITRLAVEPGSIRDQERQPGMLLHWEISSLRFVHLQEPYKRGNLVPNKEIMYRLLEAGRNRSRSILASLKTTLFIIHFLMFAACSWNSADGTRHTVVVGFAIISSKTAGPNTATATRSNLVGLAVQTGLRRGLILGYQSLQETEISPNWVGVMNVASSPGKPLTLSSFPAVHGAHGPSLTTPIQ